MPDLNFRQAKNSLPSWLLLPAIIFFISFLLAAAGLAIFEKIYQNKIYPNIFIGQLALGGLTADQARQLLNKKVDEISQEGVIFSYRGQQAAITPVISSADADLAYQLINFQVEQTVGQALNYGRGHNFFINLENKLAALLSKKRLPLTMAVDYPQITEILKNNFNQAVEPAEDARLVVEKNSDDNYNFSVAQEKLGKKIDYQEAIDMMGARLAELDNAEIKLATVTAYPVISSKNCLNIETKSKKILEQAPLILKYDEQQWIVERAELADWLALKPDDSPIDKIKIGLDEIKVKKFLAEKIAQAIDQKPLEAKFTISDGKVQEFQSGQDGLMLDQQASLEKIEKEMPGNREIELIVKVQPASSQAGDVNNLGIKEIIGLGKSNFAGSSANRRQNIKIGARTVNGSLIRPGEEFSLLKTLGEIASTTGYLPELVIKENKTVPEFGGGLCQIGTTIFRAVVDSGLPVTLRRNHSYRVSYYEPAGTDATIYDPWPDFRFVNDLPTHILIQTKISGDNLIFEFWSTRDGRKVEKTQPIIYNIVKPEPTKIIETTDLPAGQKKCTEKAHNGADAYFDYKVTYPDGQIKQKRFSSHYVPWREVCLVGVEKLSPPATASSTPPMASSTPPGANLNN